MQEVQTTLPNGTIVQGRYIVEDLLGKGGFGAVYLVRDQRVRQNLFALKEVTDTNKRERNRFLFEAELLRRLDHSALPRVYRVFDDAKNDRAYILMDYVEGPNLEVLRQRQTGKRFAVPQVLTMIKPIMDAVSYLHAQQPPIIHRDIKPANIIVPTSGDETVLVDFGIAKEYDPETTTTAIRHCSPGYGAPEQYGIGTNTRTDIYGLGATIYSILTGVVPADAFYRTTQLGSKDTDPLEPLNKLAPSVPPHVANAVHRAMSINSNARFATVEEFWEALNATPVEAATPIPVSAPAVLETSAPAASTKRFTNAKETGPVKPVERRRKRFGAILLILLALLIALASATGLFFMLSHSGAGRQSPITPITKSTQAPTATATSQPSPTPTPSPTATPPRATATPTGSFPIVASAYSGSIHNTPAGVDSTMTLTSIRQSGGNIKGVLALGSGLQGNGNFTGNVDKSKNISFLVAAFANHLPLYFSGKINADGSMSGSYCSYQNGQCNYQGGGYGTWNVSPASTGSSSITGPKSYVLSDDLWMV